MPRACHHSAPVSPPLARTFLRARHASGSWQLHVKSMARTRPRASFAAAPEHLPSATPTTGDSGSDGGSSLPGSRAPTPSLRQDDVVQLRCVSLSFTGEVRLCPKMPAYRRRCSLAAALVIHRPAWQQRMSRPGIGSGCIKPYADARLSTPRFPATSYAGRAGGVSPAEEPLHVAQRGSARRFQHPLCWRPARRNRQCPHHQDQER